MVSERNALGLVSVHTEKVIKRKRKTRGGIVCIIIQPGDNYTEPPSSTDDI